jgi:hypothetical protein
VLYNILIEFGILMKLVRLIKVCLNETYSKVRIGKYLSYSFPLQNIQSENQLPVSKRGSAGSGGRAESRKLVFPNKIIKK